MRNLTIIIVLLFGNIISAQTQIGQSIDGEALNDFFGRSVAMSSDGNTIAVGSRISDNGTETDGEIQVYSLEGNTWVQVGQNLENEIASLSADGTIVAIGSPTSSTNVFRDGSVKVFQLISDNWMQLGGTIVGNDSDAEYGQSIDLSADGLTLVIGSYRNDNNGSDSGLVQVFSYDNGVWSKIGQDILGDNEGDLSGFNVAISVNGQRVAISSHGSDENGNLSGSAKVFELNNNAWTRIGQVLTGQGDGDQLGRGLDLSSDGSTLIVGAPDNSGPVMPEEYVQVYRFDGNNWQQIGQTLFRPELGLGSGEFLSISGDGNFILTGAPSERDPITNNFIGAVTAFSFENDTWAQYRNRIYGESISSRWSSSLEISDDGQLFVSGASFHDSNGTSSGNIRVFHLDETLPVVFSDFLVKKDNKAVKIEWKTTGEINSSIFRIEHRTNTSDWVEIGSIQASNESSGLLEYTYSHNYPSLGLNFYRIKQTDLDGVSQVTEARYIEFSDDLYFSVYPNPLANDILKLTIPDDMTEGVVRILSPNGILKFECSASIKEVNLSSLSPGLYIFNIYHKGNNISKRLVKR